uniref:Biogenesis of lysosome-related organelles complex 1 subunit 3 n=1 Tax=Anopheles culicifacies TaxID=139723 RepID=A0A182MJS8_9DIPT
MECKSPNIVAGEASETDDDETEVISIEKGIPHLSSSGTAPPSYTFAREAVESSTSTPPPVVVSDEEMQRMHVRRTMNERCISLLNEFIHNTVISVSKQLNETDNFLMKSQRAIMIGCCCICTFQMVLQNTTISVKKMNDNTHQMQSKLHDILSFNFVPNINI